MDIQAIKDNIKELENADTTVENVRELALLYIVRDNLENANLTGNFNDTARELDDILPQYRKYIEIKRQYQLGQLPDTAVNKSIRNVCREIYEFISTMYSRTDMKSERDCIDELIQKLRKI